MPLSGTRLGLRDIEPLVVDDNPQSTELLGAILMGFGISRPTKCHSVEAAREVIDIPIIGGFPTSVFTALGLCQRFGILTILPSTLAMQQGMVWVGQPAMNDGTINRIGSNSGLMAQVGPTSPAEDIPQGDLDTAKAYGKRVAEVAAKLRG